MKLVCLDTCDSTNSYAALHAGELDDMTLVVSRRQDAGRGQRGNSWEAAPGLNFTGTLLFRPAPKPEGITLPQYQFAISEATALAVADTLRIYDIPPTLKWANDVYAGNKKICGILIEHTILGSDISCSRIGIGVNVNQKVFESDAPNPTSIALETGKTVPLTGFIPRLYENLERRLRAIGDAKGDEARRQHDEYRSLLWRADGEQHYFKLRNGNSTPFLATIIDVLPEGPIVLRLDDGTQQTYYFREIEFILHKEQ